MKLKLLASVAAAGLFAAGAASAEPDGWYGAIDAGYHIIDDINTEDGKNAAAVALGRIGGKARAAGMTAKKRKEIAKKAANARWRAVPVPAEEE